MEQGLTRNQIISQLIKSPHGNLKSYIPVGVQAAKEDPEFFGRMIAWNLNGQVRDSQVALPVLALTAPGLDPVLKANAQGALLRLSPRELLRAAKFCREQKAPFTPVKQAIVKSLRDIENPKQFPRVAIQHRDVLKEMYRWLRIKPADIADKMLFKGEKIGASREFGRLRDMLPLEAAGIIATKKLPAIQVMGAMKEKARDPVIVQALLGVMTPNQVVNFTKTLERWGLKDHPETRAAYEKALARVANSSRATLKTTVAAQAVGGTLGEKLLGVQEKQLAKLGGVDGDWLVLADRSSSMTSAIEVAQQVASFLARMVTGKVHLVFFNSSPTYYDVSGKTLDEITAMTRTVYAMGSTSCGVGLDYARLNKFDLDGIAIVTDGGDNTVPHFHLAYPSLCKALGKELPAYVYLVNGDPPVMLDRAKCADIDLQVFDLRAGVDYYAIPGLVGTMRTNKYSLADEIMATPLLTF